MNLTRLSQIFSLCVMFSCLSLNMVSAQQWTELTVADGLVGDSVISIHEDQKGYLWFITEFSGATRYDGARFQNLSALNGLSSNNINFTLADSIGNVWFATDRGVSKFDGFDFENFDRTNGICSDYITFIFEDSQGTIWFGTDKGICTYDGKSFSNLESNEGLVESNITFILEDREKKIWLGTNKGVLLYDRERFLTIGAVISSQTVQFIFEDSEGNLWFGTENGIYRKGIKRLNIEGPFARASVASIMEGFRGDIFFATHNRGVIRYNPRNEVFDNPFALVSPTVLSILQDSRSIMWFGSDKGISKYDGETIEHLAEFIDSPWNFVRQILEDSDGNLWFATQNGVLEYSIGDIQQFTRNEGLCNNSIKTIMEDNEGILWLGAENGVVKYDGSTFITFTTEDGLVDNNTMSILQDRKGDFWFGSASGVCRNFEKIKGVPYQLNTAVKAILEDRKGNLWFATAEGICFRTEQEFKFFPLEGITCLFQDSIDNIWIGTFSAGVFKYDGREELTCYSMEDGLGCNHIIWILESHDGNIWLGLKGGVTQDESGGVLPGGICRYDHSSFENISTKNGLPSDLITVGLEDREGNLWLGTTDRGVIKYDIHTEDPTARFQNISKDEGLISNYVTAILSDRDGNLWFGTDKGIAKYDGENIQNIFLEEYLTLGGVESIFEGRKGNMWFITAGNGIIKYIPPIKETRPRVHIVCVESNKIYRNMNEIKVPTTAKRLTFEFKGISFKTKPEGIRYIYMLEGVDQDWSPSTHEQKVDYRNMKHGTYRFLVKAIDKDLHYSDPPARVTVHLYKPFHTRPEFFFIVIFLGICLLGGVGYLAFQEKRQRAIAAEFKVKLTKQKEAERIQAAKMESLRRLVAGVAHEMNNPIGVISSSQDVSRRGIDTITKFLKQNYPQEMKKDTQLLGITDLLKNTNKACQNASERVAKIVANLRRFVRLDEGEWQKTDIHPGLDSVVALLEPEIGKRITVKKEYGDIPHIYCSPSSLNQVFMVILKNAVEAIPDKGEIKIKTFSKDDKLKVEITDTGIGIPHQNINKIFDPGFTTKGVSVGVGLGLSICYKIIVDEHKGRIDVSSEVGKWSTFTISLPVRSSDHQSERG